MIILKVGDKFPKTCEHCPLYYKYIHPNCVGGGRYTEEEIEAEKYGAENMYYHGYLSKRPQNCPLKEVEVEEEPHWIDLTDYCPTAYGDGDDPHEPNWNFECSKCGSHIFTDFTPDQCPNCKADMKGVEGGKP